jgi:hypothetical protein
VNLPGIGVRVVLPSPSPARRMTYDPQKNRHDRQFAE